MLRSAKRVFASGRFREIVSVDEAEPTPTLFLTPGQISRGRHGRDLSSPASRPAALREIVNYGQLKIFRCPLETKIRFFYFSGRHRKMAPGRLMGPGN